MILPSDPRRLAEDLLSRSECAVQVAAVLADKDGIFSWGWNHMGTSGFGKHAEAHALERANKKRLWNSTIYVAAIRAKSKNPVLSKPCPECDYLLETYNITAWYRNKNGVWTK